MHHLSYQRDFIKKSNLAATGVKLGEASCHLNMGNKTPIRIRVRNDGNNFTACSVTFHPATVRSG